ncbi:MAG: AAA family ATPase [Lachnospiraceae bacterium]|nr:AAA family ATPase [Lachnospiraceae bacterium]
MATDYFNTPKISNSRKLNKIIDELRYDLERLTVKNEAFQDILDSLERIKKGDEEPKIKPLALYLDILESIHSQSSLPGTFTGLHSNAEALYNSLFLFGEDTPEFEKTAEIYKLLAGENGLVVKGFFDPVFFASFTDKTDYLNLVTTISTQPNAVNLFNGIRTHALEVRPFFIDNSAYMSYLFNLVSKMRELNPDIYESFLKDELAKVQRVNGVYDIDPVRLSHVENNVRTVELTIENGKSILEALELKSRDLQHISQELDEHSAATLRNAEDILKTKVRNAGDNLDEALKDHIAAQKQAISLEKDIFLKQLFSDAEAELAKLKAMAGTITGTVSAEINSMSKDADEIIRQLNDASDKSEKLIDYSKQSKDDTELLDKIAKLQLLNDNMIEQLGAALEKKASEKAAPVQPVAPAAAADSAAAPSAPVVTVSRRTERPIPAVSHLLDRRVPFSERFELAMKEKNRRMQGGELFHEMFDDVLIAVMEEVNPYLIGPSGCGKTYMVGQIGEILNVDLTDIGYINEEYDILGYVTAMGEYSESNFYRLYKYGGIAFCDELDNGNSKATVKLNSFLTNRIHAGYCFPGGEFVEKHPNFRVIAAGNTDGSGADLNYSTRERIEESVQQRMIPIYVDYDNRVEQAILKDHPDWFAFSCAFRKATSQWSSSSGIPAQGIFTTRDAFRIKQYLDNGSFSAQKIMNYEFVQTKESEYLAFLMDAMGKMIRKDSAEYQIYSLFAAEVERIRLNGR